MTTNGWDIHGRPLAEQRSVSMTTTTPPPTGCWTTNTAADYKNTPPPSPADQEVWKEQRLAWLSKYDLEISLQPEQGYRYWRWLDGNTQAPRGHLCRDGKRRLVVWFERRLFEAPLPLVPGLWPADN